ncbi:MAG: hypothetical protein ACUVWJ_08235 [Spirochaetota bacterium]
MKKVLHYYPFTLSGTALLIISIILLGKSYATGNHYGLLIALLAFSALLILSICGRLQAAHLGRIKVQWDTTGLLQAGVDGKGQKLWLNGMKPAAFYRVHFRVSGRLKAGRDAYMFLIREASSAGGEKIEIPLLMPVSGELDARGTLSLRDIFGLTRTRFGQELRRKLFIQPAPFRGIKSYHIEALGGYEEKHRQKSTNEERYFMREYIPGDRYRDINWKSSSRLSQLFTKISPFTQEKTRVIKVEFRHFRSDKRETVESIVHLNKLKSWLLYFIRAIKQENPDYQFMIKTGRGIFHIEREEDIELFSLELCSLFFEPEIALSQADQGTGELYIFSTPYDENLPSVLASYRNTSVYIFTTASPAGGFNKPETVYLFPSLKAMAFPDLWILKRERFLKKPAVMMPERGRIEEYLIEVKILGREQ